MSKLEDLYEGKVRLERAGYKLSPEQLHDLESLEEQLIKDEVLPTLSKDIEPRLTKIQRELVLVVEYKPEAPIRVSLSRKRNITELIDDAKLLEINPEVEHGTNPNYKKKEKVDPKTNIRVEYQGTTYESPVAAQTFVKVIERIGIARVRALGLTWCKIPLISTTEDKKYSQQPSGRYYIITHSSSQQKQRQLNIIAKELGLDIKVDLIDKDGNVVIPPKRNREKQKKEEKPAKEKQSAGLQAEKYTDFVMQKHQERTAKWYTTVLNKQVRSYIAQLVDEHADSIFSFKTADEVQTCIDLLKESKDFMADNKRQKNVMTAALNKYLLFIQNEEK